MPQAAKKHCPFLSTRRILRAQQAMPALLLKNWQVVCPLSELLFFASPPDTTYSSLQSQQACDILCQDLFVAALYKSVLLLSRNNILLCFLL